MLVRFISTEPWRELLEFFKWQLGNEKGFTSLKSNVRSGWVFILLPGKVISGVCFGIAQTFQLPPTQAKHSFPGAESWEGRAILQSFWQILSSRVAYKQKFRLTNFPWSIWSNLGVLKWEKTKQNKVFPCGTASYASGVITTVVPVAATTVWFKPWSRNFHVPQAWPKSK